MSLKHEFWAKGPCLLFALVSFDHFGVSKTVESGEGMGEWMTYHFQFDMSSILFLFLRKTKNTKV